MASPVMETEPEVEMLPGTETIGLNVQAIPGWLREIDLADFKIIPGLSNL